MAMRTLFALTCSAMLTSSCAGSAVPEFVPSPRQAFEGFVALNPPRGNVPVGALWLNGHGAIGTGAAADNLETIQSVSGVTIDKELQIELSIGVLDMLGVNPKLRDSYTARFTNLSIVRVKDTARLPNPSDKPRIVEALKAGSLTVTSNLKLEMGADKSTAVKGLRASAVGARARTYAIEGRDLFIAVKIAKP